MALSAVQATHLADAPVYKVEAEVRWHSLCPDLGLYFGTKHTKGASHPQAKALTVFKLTICSSELLEPPNFTPPAYYHVGSHRPD
jgi:hypothetical protein